MRRRGRSSPRQPRAYQKPSAALATGITAIPGCVMPPMVSGKLVVGAARSEEHTSELQSHSDLVCRLLLEKKKKYVVSGPPSMTVKPVQRIWSRNLAALHAQTAAVRIHGVCYNQLLHSTCRQCHSSRRLND